MKEQRENGEAPDSFSLLVEDLKWLRRGAGLTLTRLRSRRAVQASPAVAGRLRGTGNEEAVHVAYGLVCELLRDLGNGREASALRAAYAFEYAGDPGNLTIRRRKLMAEFRVHEDTLENWENSSISELALQLLGTEEPATPRVDEPSRARKAQADDFAAWIDSVYVVVDAEHTFRFDQGRVPSEIQCLRVVRALEDGVDTFLLPYWHSTDRRPGVAHVVPLEGIEVDSVSYLGDGYFITTVRFPRPLMQGEEHRFTWKVAIESTVEPKPFSVQIPLTYTERLAVRVQFQNDSRPQRVWRVDALPPLALPGEYSEDRAIEIDRLAYTEARFTDVEKRLAYGVGWEW